MIKQFSALLLLSAIVLFACNKDNEKLPDEGQNFSDIFIDSVADMSVRRRSSDTLHIHVSATSEARTTSLSIAGLPAGITGSFDPASAIPPFTSILTLTADSAAVVGSSASATITVSINSSHKTERNLNVTVLPATDECAPDFAGTWSIQSSGSFGGSSGITTITPDQDMPYTRIRIANLGGSGYTVYADLDCVAGTAYIPHQNFAGMYQFTGGGYFTRDSMTFNCAVITFGNPNPGGFFSRLQRQ